MLAVICLALNQKINALTTATCQVCKRWFNYSCAGTGYGRDLRVTCGRCAFRDKFNDVYTSESDLVDVLMNLNRKVEKILRNRTLNPWEKFVKVASVGARFYQSIDESGMRFITFDDGKVLDLAHVVATAPFGSMGYGGEIPIYNFFQNYFHQVGANLVGFGKELHQWLEGHDSGHPFGGNEDSYSNWIGSQIGANGIIQHGHGELGNQLADYFESLGHGAISGHQGQQPVHGLGGCS